MPVPAAGGHRRRGGTRGHEPCGAATAPSTCTHGGPAAAPAAPPHVLLPASCLPRRAVTVDIVGAALLAKADGASHQGIVTDLDVPVDTVRGWVRRATATATASWLHDRGTTLAHQLDPMLAAMASTGTALGDAVAALAAAAGAATRRLSPLAPADQSPPPGHHPAPGPATA